MLSKVLVIEDKCELSTRESSSFAQCTCLTKFFHPSVEG